MNSFLKFLIIVSIAFSLFHCGSNKRKRIQYVGIGKTSKFQKFGIQNDTLVIIVDTVSKYVLNSHIKPQVILAIEDFSYDFYIPLCTTKVVNLNQIKIPLSKFQIIPGIVNQDPAVKLRDDLIADSLLNNPVQKVKYLSKMKIYWLEAWVSSSNPTFRKEGEDFVPVWFCRFRNVDDTVRIEQDFDLYIIDEANLY